MRVRIRDTIYADADAAAAAFGVARATVMDAIRNGTEDRIGLRHAPGSTRKIPVVIEGVSYPSLSEASRQLKIPKTTMQKRYHSGKLLNDYKTS